MSQVCRDMKSALENNMNLFELFILAIGLSLDAFAVAICLGLTTAKNNLKIPLVIGLYFGGFQAVMPLVGYLVATLFAKQIIAYDHWVACGLLSYLGIKMILNSRKSADCPDPDESPSFQSSLSPAVMLPLALATSIDALAVGVSFAFLRVSIVPAVSFIGVTTFCFSVAGVKIGRVFGLHYKTKAEMAGGIILILIGLKLLLEHLSINNF